MRISDWSSDVCSSDLPSRTTPKIGGCTHDRGERLLAGLHILHDETDAVEGVELELLELLIEKRGAETEPAEVELQPKLIGVDLLRRETKVGHADAVGVQPRPVEIVTARLISL